MDGTDGTPILILARFRSDGAFWMAWVDFQVASPVPRNSLGMVWFADPLTGK